MKWRAELIALAVVLLVCVAAARRVALARSGVALEESRSTKIAQRVDVERAEAQSVTAILAHNPFRISRRPMTPVADSRAVDATPYRPNLQVTAVIGGPPWSALITGVPGTSRPTLVTAGARVDSLDVVAISRDTVRLRGPDTAWTLVILRKTP